MRSIEENFNYFLEADLSNYADEWVAIIDKSVVSYGKNVKAVYEDAVKKFPNKKPFLTKISSSKRIIL